MQNNIVVNAGTYKTATTQSSSGKKVSSILFTNSRITDSAAYYTFASSIDSLEFSHDLIGTVGSGAKMYCRIH